jgi:tryptophan-rich sensory protein
VAIKIPNALKLIIALVACQLAGVIGSVFTTRSIDTWYRTLIRPSYAPPNGVFAPVWISLYVLMGIAAFIVWRRGLQYPGVREGLLAFLMQLVLNACWSIAFFGLRSPLAGLVVIIVLWIEILITIIYFFRVSRNSGLLMLPYIAWVSFAAVLNYGFFALNR